MKKIVLVLIIVGLFSSCNPTQHYFRNGVGEWEYIQRYEKIEGPRGERTIQTFSIGDSTYSFVPASDKAEEWIANRRETLRQRAIANGKNVDFFIDRNIDEGERRY